MAKSISAQQRKFANEWIRTHNAYQSAIYAGYAPTTAKNATQRLLENAGISKYISSKTKKVEQKESDEADEVLKNIYRIASGRSISHDFVRIDNLRKKETTNETTVAPAPFKEQVNAAELWFKLGGQLKNESKEIEKQRARKIKADAELAELRVKQADGSADSQVVVNVHLPEDGDGNG